jgi:hypothetical protein
MSTGGTPSSRRALGVAPSPAGRGSGLMSPAAIANARLRDQLSAVSRAPPPFAAADDDADAADANASHIAPRLLARRR